MGARRVFREDLRAMAVAERERDEIKVRWQTRIAIHPDCDRPLFQSLMVCVRSLDA